MPNKKTLVLIDGNAIIHRSFHALPPLTTKKGELVNAVYGFSSTLLTVISKFKPDYIAASFDLAGPTFRHKEYKEYKATRTKAPDELYEQIPKVKEVVKTFNIPIYEQEGVEADDVIGTLAAKVEKDHPELEIIIVTGDKDTLQLVSDKTKVFTMRRGITDSVLFDEKGVLEHYGFKPERLIDFKGLCGDPSDNIPGVKGIGKKGATNLIQAYGSLEKIYENIDDIKGATQKKLIAEKENAFMSKMLGTIKQDVEFDFNLDDAVTAEFDKEKVSKLFSDLNFFSLIKRLPGNDENKKPAATKQIKGITIRGTQIDGLIKDVQQSKALSLEPLVENDVLKGICMSADKKTCYFIENTPKHLKKLELILESKDVKKIGYDLKSTYKILSKNHIHLTNLHFDVIIAAYVLNPGTKIELDKLVLSELGENVNFEDSKSGQLTMDLGQKIAEEKVDTTHLKLSYICRLQDAFTIQMKKISAEQNNLRHNLMHLFEKVEMPLVEILAKMELNGIKIDPSILEATSANLGTKIKQLEEDIYKLSGTTFNINSPSQLQEILFQKLTLPTDDIKKIKTGYSTAASELEKLRDKHKIISKIEDYREYFKLKTTYLDTLPSLINTDSRIHTTFHQEVTATGRLSSSDPNLQNIPIKSEFSSEIRKAFVAKQGYKLISADYSQIDLRVVAHLSGDETLIKAFKNDADIHTITASQVYKIKTDEVSKEARSNAKALNFSIIYGAGPYGFSQYAGISVAEAKDFIKKYFNTFPKLAEFIEKTKKQAHENEYVETLEGRRRNVPEINSSNFQVANAAERMAINMPVQGLSADIMKIAMINVFKTYRNNPDVKMILQVHDEIILEVKEENAEKVKTQMIKIMEESYNLDVPLKVDAEIGDNWGEL